MITGETDWVFRPPKPLFEFLALSRSFDRLGEEHRRGPEEFASAAKEFVLEFCGEDQAPLHTLRTANTESKLGVRIEQTAKYIFPLTVELYVRKSNHYFRFSIKQDGDTVFLGQCTLPA